MSMASVEVHQTKYYNIENTMVVLHPAVMQNQSRAVVKLLDKHLHNKEYLEAQFWQKSQIPTYHFQRALPRLPIPELKLTCERYLTAQRPLLNDNSYKKTETLVSKFQSGAGNQLQKLLKEYDRNHKNSSYISEFWFDKYLKSRAALPISCNPVLVLNNDDKSGYNDQITRTTNLIISSLRFYKSLTYGFLHPEIFHLNPVKSDTDQLNYILSKLHPRLAYILAYLNKAYPLDMSQYGKLFKTTRIPEIDQDRIVTDSKAKHITVQFKGHFYAFDVLNSDDEIVSADLLFNNICLILNKNRELNKYPIGVLTTLERNQWASLRQQLKDNGNENALKTIDSALFNICLDTYVSEDPGKTTKQFLHGDGTNRWFDKSFSLIVSKDGATAVNFEHAWGDGVAVLRYIQDIYKDSQSKPTIHPNHAGASDNCTVEEIDFQLNDSLRKSIEKTKIDFKHICDNLDVNYTIFEGIGKTTCKKNKVSPDAVMQLGFQVAYHKLTGSFVSTYESCSTAAFKHGRTEAIRPNSIATKEFALAINSKSNLSVPELKSMIQNCSNIHNKLIKEAAMGQGFDRHLFALKTLSEKHDIACDFFSDPNYIRLGYDIMSTSTLNSPAIFAGGFGAVVPDGFGIGYVIKDDFVGSLVTNYKDQTNGSEFINALKKSFEEVFSILKVE